MPRPVCIQRPNTAINRPEHSTRQQRMNRQLLPRISRLLSQHTTLLPICHFHRHRRHRHRQLSTTCSNLLLPPSVFLGLGITLWTWKCFMMILFQNKIIYMPNIPPFSRTETVEDYAGRCRPVQWKEDSLVTGDGVKLSLVIGDVPRDYEEEGEMEEEDVVILYFQGNAASLPPRLPFLSDVLKIANAKQNHKKKNISIVAVSYRGFWRSTGKPSQKGIERDADAALHWVLERYYSNSSPPDRPREFVIWGQSIGAGVATNLTAHYLNNPLSFQPDHSRGKETTTVVPITSLILETPFTSIRDLLLAFYPQKWLPYHYLGPFLRSHWDSVQALQRIAQAPGNQKKPNIFMLEAGSDEVVPAGNAQKLEGLCKTLKLDVERRVIGGALHSNVVAKWDGQLAIARFLRENI